MFQLFNSNFIFMLKNTLKFVLLALTVAGVASSCKKKDDDSTPTVQLRTKIDVNQATDTTTYARLFVDEKGASTVDVNDGNALLVLFSDSLVAYARKGTAQEITVAGLKQRYTATNNAGKGVRSLTASSREINAESEAIRTDIEDLFDLQAEASKSRGNTASKGKAGMLGTYLVNEAGLEGVQLIAKGLIGNFQMDYIGNVLLGSGLDADNSKLVAGKKYTELEHNWDLAYSTFTKKSYYGKDAKLAPGTTGATSGESQLGSYVWEYNQDAFKQMNKAFVRGRIAIVNNDRNELKTQADFIRKAFEKAVAQAALGYLKKWKDAGTNTASAAHAIGEGAGFIYSLRAAKLNGGSDKFSDDILDGLLGSEGGFWDLTNEKINTAGTAISEKFGVARPY